MNQTAHLALRVGLAFSFLYPAISAIFNPFAWIGYFPLFLLDLAPNQELLLHAFGVVEVILALWILSGKQIFIPSLLAAAMLLGIVIFNFSQMDVLFRDVTILLMAVALAIESRPRAAAPATMAA